VKRFSTSISDTGPGAGLNWGPAGLVVEQGRSCGRRTRRTGRLDRT